MNSVIMDNVELGDECIIGALSFIKADEKIPGRSLFAGNPAKFIREVSDEMMEWKTAGTALYQSLPASMRESWEPCEPITKAEADRPSQEILYETWNKIKNKEK
jgi:phenylacetic acid degradation protein/carnitine operon protein CaiE